MTDFSTHPEMVDLLHRQKCQRDSLIEYLSDPAPRFVAKTVQGFWVCWDRLRGDIAVMCDSEREAKAVCAEHNEELA